MAPARIQLGREASLSERSYSWLTAEAVEIDEVDGYDVARRRVLLDEVQLVTLHRKRRIGLLVALGLMVCVFGLPLLLASPGSRSSGAFIGVFTFFCAPFAIMLVAHLALGTDYVTLFGKRSRARMAFNLRKGRAREVFALLTREVQAVQGVTAAAPPAMQPAVEPSDSPAAEGA